MKSRSSSNTKPPFLIRHLLLLLWKNLLFRRRHYLVTAFEIFLPTLCAFIIAFMKTLMIDSGGTVEKNDTIYSPTSPYEYYSHTSTELLCPGCILAFSPNNDQTNELMKMFKQKYNETYPNDPDYDFMLRPMEDEKEMETYLAASDFLDNIDPPLKVGIVFQEIGDNKVSYTLRPASYTIHTNTIFSWLQLPGPELENSASYLNGGVAGLQIALDKILIEYMTKNNNNGSGSGEAAVASLDQLQLRAFPYPPYFKAESFSNFYFIIFPQLFIIGFIFIVPSIVRNVVSERESGIKELMKLMGLPNWIHWFGWLLNSILILSISVSIVMVLLFTKFNPEAGAVITFGDVTVWWVVFFLYAMAATSFCFFISIWSEKVTLATTIGIVLWIVSYYALFVPLESSYRTLTLSSKLLAGLSPNMALHWAIKVMCSFEGTGVGSQWSNIFKSISLFDELSLFHVCAVFIFDIVFYFTLTLYFENILPSKYGIRKPWWYIFMPSTWSPSKNRQIQMRRASLAPPMSKHQDSSHFERDPPAATHPPSIKIKNLKKQFGNKTAVNSINLKIYPSQITAFLGHNGAGKTTTISILTGLFKATEGTAIINGYDINEDLEKIRESLGLCPQFNMLFDKLTVYEHLIFFGRIKGKSGRQAANEAKILIEKLQLNEKMNTISMELSGGQKRKLCLGMALIGGTKIVILDEPTSGMDPEARRVIWDLLLELRNDRTILLTTHFMEEADILGDRIAIMAEGEIECVGSPVFLKNRFGTGYTLKLATTLTPNANAILELTQKYIPGATIKRNTPPTIDINLGQTEDRSTYSKLFTELSLHENDYGIVAKGLSPTTMDEVFLHVGDLRAQKNNAKNGHRREVLENANNSNSSSNSSTSTKTRDTHNLNGEELQLLSGLNLTMTRIVALFKKKIIYTYRHKLLMLLQFVIPPVLLVFAILLSSQTFTPAISSPPLKMDLKPYKEPHILYSPGDNENYSAAYTTLFHPPASIHSTGDSRKPLLNLGLAVLDPDILYSLNETAAENSTTFSPLESIEPIHSDLIQALLKVGQTDLGSYREQYIFAADFNNLTAMYSTSPHHSVPLTINFINNAILKSFNSEAEITTTIHPLENELSSVLEAAQPNPAYTLLVPIIYGALVPIALALFASTFLIFPTEERISKSKQLQLMSGVSLITFWLTSFLWDLLIMLVAIIILICMFPLFESYGSYSSYNGLGVMFLILLVWGVNGILFSYLFSLFVPSTHGGYAAQTIINILTGLILPIAAFSLNSSSSTPTSTPNTLIRLFGSFFPTFGASMSIMRYSSIATANGRCNIIPTDYKSLFCKDDIEVDPLLLQCCDNCADINNKPYITTPACFEPAPFLTWSHTTDSVEYYGIGRELFYMSLCTVFYLVLLIIFESKFYQMLKPKSNPGKFESQVTDSDVLAEANKEPSGKDALVVKGLCKQFGNFIAINNLDFSVSHSECFGLLGVNGAGKTTTFKILTGDEEPTYGNISNSKFESLRRNRSNFLARIGYCPQFDAIITVLTGWEMLELFARLRGVQRSQMNGEIEKWLTKLGLIEAAHVECGKYSGGMKRRLSVAMAMIANPDIIFLDEPTSGVDPVARRQFWEVISSLRSTNQSVILTSHSMEECESLCSRLAIMVNGQFQCIGSVQRLKSKYAIGYSLILQLAVDIEKERIDLIKDEIMSVFAPCRLQDEHQNVLQFQILSTQQSWETLFTQIELIKQNYSTELIDYLLSETSLEQVFLNFARQQYSSRRLGGETGGVGSVKKFVREMLLLKDNTIVSSNNVYNVNGGI